MLNQSGGPLHGLSGHPQCLSSRQAHGHSAINSGLQHQGKERWARTTKRGGRIHGAGWEVHDISDALEDPRHQAGNLRRQWRLRRGDDSHALADHGRRVGHGAHHAAGVLDVLGPQGTLQMTLDLGHGDAGADADEELAAQSLRNARLGQHVANHLRLAGEDHDAGLLDRGEVVVLHDLDDGRVLCQRHLDLLGALGTPHARDEPAGQAVGDLGHPACRHVLKRGEDAGQDGNPHRAAAQDRQGQLAI
ncbi:uncharacterized protein PgNI_09859 [Pyricularia grisea]|uniref:Uncharacterized protein n=1 Tax=Pyricularia grisea TaxID=148305 RepID=A0A6P8ARY7_PYRGI|nr:uncharacterized protein PgNI_09859 [Pyricularia grisea]TLD04857.1 hypothetical protein PgNI_09859 [Pyricularia grisea]